MNPDDATRLLRPRDLTLLLLASRDLLPRRRARDQQADLAGLKLMRRVLEEVAAIDPEPGELEAALERIAAGIEGPSGPVRAIIVQVRDDWRTACASPEWVAHLIAQATEDSASREESRG